MTFAYHTQYSVTQSSRKLHKIFKSALGPSQANLKEDLSTSKRSIISRPKEKCLIWGNQYNNIKILMVGLLSHF